jgi:hypothetical protein
MRVAATQVAVLFPPMATVEEPTVKASGPSLPVLVLTVLGTVVAVLGFLVGGNLLWTGLGLGAVMAAGILGLLEKMVDARARR